MISYWKLALGLLCFALVFVPGFWGFVSGRVLRRAIASWNLRRRQRSARARLCFLFNRKQVSWPIDWFTVKAELTVRATLLAQACEHQDALNRVAESAPLDDLVGAELQELTDKMDAADRQVGARKTCFWTLFTPAKIVFPEQMSDKTSFKDFLPTSDDGAPTTKPAPTYPALRLFVQRG